MDFRDKSVRKDKSKASVKETVRLDFWQDYINKIENLESTIQIQKPLKDWLESITEDIELKYFDYFSYP